MENVWSGSPTYTTVVNLADPDFFVDSVSLSGPYIAYIVRDQNANGDTLFCVDLTSVTDFSAGLPTPVEIPMPQAWSDDGIVVNYVSIALTEMAITSRGIDGPAQLSTTRDFRTVTATNWTEFDGFPTGFSVFAQIDMSFPTVLPKLP